MRDYYSSADKAAYRDLQEESTKLKAKMKKVVKKSDVPQIDLELGILTKKAYNRYAPKVYRATTKAEPDNVKQLIAERDLFKDAETMLFKLIDQFKQI